MRKAVLCSPYIISKHYFESNLEKAPSMIFRDNLQKWIQSVHGYSAMSGLAPIRLSNFAEYANYAQTQQVQEGSYMYMLHNVFTRLCCILLQTVILCDFYKWKMNKIMQNLNRSVFVLSKILGGNEWKNRQNTLENHSQIIERYPGNWWSYNQGQTVHVDR